MCAGLFSLYKFPLLHRWILIFFGINVTDKVGNQTKYDEDESVLMIKLVPFF